MGLAGAMLASIAVILLLGTIFYGIATNSQIEPSDRLSGGFLFEETHSASTSQSTPPPESPPASPAKPPPDMEAEPDPEPVPDLPVYTTEEVMALANSFSPECKALPSGVG